MTTTRTAKQIIDELRWERAGLKREEEHSAAKAAAGYGRSGFLDARAQHTRSRIRDLERELAEVSP